MAAINMQMFEAEILGHAEELSPQRRLRPMQQAIEEALFFANTIA